MVRVKLDDYANMNHMSALGQCGLDLYVYNANLVEYVFHNSSVYDSKVKEYEYHLGKFETAKERHFILNLPLYMEPKDLKIGLEEDAYINLHGFINKEKIVFYGTSITQGGCVSRPGMLHTNILSRWLDREIFNFGFSGSAFLEPEVGKIIAEKTFPKIIVIDAQANAGIDERLEKNLDPFIKEIRKVPIIIVSRIHFAVDLYDSEKLRQRKYYERFIKNYVDNSQMSDGQIFY